MPNSINTVYLIVRIEPNQEKPLFAFKKKDKAESALSRLNSGKKLYKIEPIWVED